MSVAMDIIRALDPSGLERFKINLDKPAPKEKIGEVHKGSAARKGGSKQEGIQQAV
jgi:hypothetical protein